MSTDLEKTEREGRARRLKWARLRSPFKGPKSVANALKISVDTYKAHEQGRNGFGTADAKAYAKLFGVSLPWLYFDVGGPDDEAKPDKLEKLREIFSRIADAPELQDKIISYAEWELTRYEAARDETTAKPAA